ncbi:signal peptidase I [Clostridium chrysemydis]|uniref:signal peptidase I n=1 Tax=Clostridium chrysemydis TaxID=2665504 RepID=UPI002367C168|nr:signal peptidase I [Clostridium chrysemydis]
MCNKKNKIIKILFNLFLVLCAVYVCMNFRILRVSGESMAPTLKDNQLKIIRKSDFYENKDIIVFKKDSESYVKRVIAIDGDRVELKDGKVYINNILQTNYNYSGEKKAFNLKEGEFFVIGDNYQNSLDSRAFGVIKENDIIGKLLA